MTKRPGGDFFAIPQNKKKQKTDDIWGDEDELDINECILQATQRVEAEDQIQNTSIQVPSTFRDFNKNSSMCMSSTLKSIFQVPNCPSTSKAQAYPKLPLLNASQVSAGHLKFQRNSSTESISNSGMQNLIYKGESKNVQKDLLSEIERLKSENKQMADKCMAKDGEATILRHQIKQAQKTIETVRLDKFKSLENQKEEWTKKVSTLNNDIKSFKTEMEMKNMEVMNLKERCRNLESNVAKRFNSTLSQQSQAIQQNHRSPDVRQGGLRTKRNSSSIAVQTVTEKVALLVIDVSCYPLSSELSRSNFQENNSSIKNRLIEYSEDIEGNSKLSTNPLIDVTIKLGNDDILSLDYISGEIDELKKLTQEALDSSLAHSFINKVIYVSQELLLNNMKLVLSRRKVPKNNKFRLGEYFFIKSIPKVKDLLSSRSLCELESSIVARQIITILSIIGKYNSYLGKYVSGSNLYVENDQFINTNENNFIELNIFKRNPDNREHLFLKMILQYTAAIREHNCTNHSSGVLLAILQLLSECIKNNNFSRSGKLLLLRILKEIVLSCPPFAVLCYVTRVIASCSTDPEFLSLLCHNSSKDCFKKQSDKVIFKDDSCLLQLYSVQIEKYIHENKTELWLTLKQTWLLTNFFYNQSVNFKHGRPKINSCYCTHNTMHCYLKFLNISLLNISNNRKTLTEPEFVKIANILLKHAATMSFIFACTKGTDMYQLFILHRQNIHLLNELADYLSFGSELKTILEELEADNDDQATLQSPKLFQRNKAKRLINTRF